MPAGSLAQHVDQMANVLREMMRLRARLKVALPEDVVKLRRLVGGQFHLRDEAKVAAKMDLFFRIASLLSGLRGGLAMGELSKALDVPLSTATRMVDWQAAHGYVERLPDANDRRVVRVALTRAGRRLYRNANGFVRRRVERALRRFAAEEREKLISLLQRLVVVLGELES